MSGSATLLSVVACSIGIWNWLSWPEAQPYIVAEPDAPSPAAEFACSCSCPSPSVIVAQSSAGFDWKLFLIGVLSLLWVISCGVFCRSRAREPTVIYQQLPATRGHGFAAIDDYTDALADRRAIHVRGLRGGRGTMA